MTSSSITGNLQKIRQTESDARGIVEGAEKKKVAIVDDARKEAKKLLEKAQHELRKYEEFVLEQSRAEAEGSCERLRQRAKLEVSDLNRIAGENRKKTVELIMKSLAEE